jgi:hypothetical protein
LKYLRASSGLKGWEPGPRCKLGLRCKLEPRCRLGLRYKLGLRCKLVVFPEDIPGESSEAIPGCGRECREGIPGLKEWECREGNLRWKAWEFRDGNLRWKAWEFREGIPSSTMV